MADFYLLPSRPVVGEEIARLVRPFLPGLRVTAADGLRFLEELVGRSGGRAFLIHPEDLPDEADLAASLRDGFGAADGDRVIRVSDGTRTLLAELTEPVEVY
jgi:hypothetical protein